jgi:uncharacterized membrane protein YraQ (UPF0718 family)
MRTRGDKYLDDPFVNNPALTTAPPSYRVVLAGFMFSLALTLLALLDVRRGFLFVDYPVRTLFYVLAPSHALMLAGGVAGMYASHRGLRSREAHLLQPSHLVRTLTFVILALLVIDLFVYRGVLAARSMTAGRVGLDWMAAFGVAAWWKPVAQATSYLLNVWHATMLGLLLSGLALTMLPVFFTSHIARNGFTGSLLGALFALTQPFCSCCSSVMAPSLVRRGASTTFLLSFILGAPMLNITTITLALALLPLPFAATRILAGLVVTVLVANLVARLADRWDRSDVTKSAKTIEPARRSGWLRRIGDVYLGLLDLDRLMRQGAVRTPSQLFSQWLSVSGRLGLVLVPTLWLWSVIASALFQALPSAFGNNLPSVVLAAFGGTFFMISTWSEIPMALELINAGYDGPAAALLVVLPAISLPCMILLAGTLRRVRMVAVLSAAVMIVGIVAGTMFL